MKKYLPRAKSRGFSLIEVVLACTVLILFLTAGIILIVGAGRSTVTSRHRTQAIYLANEGLDLAHAWRDAGFFAGTSDIFTPVTGPLFVAYLNNPVNLVPCFNFDLASVASSDCTPTLQMNRFYRQVTVEDRGLGAEAKKVTMTVSWKDFGQDKSVKLSTYSSEL